MPHSVVVELNLRNVAVLGNTKGQVVGESLGEVGFEVAVMVRKVRILDVYLPVLADVRADMFVMPLDRNTPAMLLSVSPCFSTS